MARFKAFLSYSRTDKLLATALKSGLEQFAKPWYLRRAFRVFRDEAILSADHALWPSIEAALDESEYFILLASPVAAQSPWVSKEIQHWLAHRPSDHMLIVLTDGNMAWDSARQDFDWNLTNAVPSILDSKFSHEPNYVDLRDFKSADDLSADNPVFRTHVAKLAAKLHGQELDDLIGEDLLQHKRSVRIRWTAITTLTFLLVASVVLSVFANTQRIRADREATEALRQRDIAISRQLAAQAVTRSGTRPDLALLLSREALMVAETTEAVGSMLTVLARNSGLLKYLWGHSDTVNRVAFSPDGELLASAGNDGRVILWDTRTLSVGQTIVSPEGFAQDVAFSPDGQRLAVPGFRRVTIFDASSGTEIGSLQLSERTQLSSVAFSPDGSVLVAGSWDGHMFFWDWPSGELLQSTQAPHHGGVNRLAFSPDGEHLASASDDRSVIVWDVLTRAPIDQMEVESPFGLVTDVMFSPDGKTLAVAGGSLYLLDLTENKVMAETGAGTRTLAFSPDGRLLAWAGFDGDITLWDTRLMEEVEARHAHEGGVFSLAFSADGRFLASGGVQGTVIVWNAELGSYLGQSVHTDGTSAVAFSPDQRLLAAAIADGRIVLYDGETGSPIQEALVGHVQTVSALAFSPDGDLLASGGFDEHVMLWDTATGRPKQGPLVGHSDRVTALAFSSDGETLVSAAANGELHTWDVETGRLVTEVASTTRGFLAVALLQDQMAARAIDDGSVEIFNFQGGSSILANPLSASALDAVAISNDGKTVAGGNGRGVVFLWNVDTGGPPGPPLVGGAERITTLEFSPDSSTLISGNSIGVVRLWDVSTGLPLGEDLHLHRDLLLDVEFSPDGRLLASAGHDGLMLWNAHLDSWTQLACHIANRDLSPAEWDTFLGTLIPYRATCSSFTPNHYNHPFFHVHNVSKTGTGETNTDGMNKSFSLGDMLGSWRVVWDKGTSYEESSVLHLDEEMLTRLGVVVTSAGSITFVDDDGCEHVGRLSESKDYARGTYENCNSYPDWVGAWEVTALLTGE